MKDQVEWENPYTMKKKFGSKVIREKLVDKRSKQDYEL